MCAALYVIQCFHVPHFIWSSLGQISRLPLCGWGDWASPKLTACPGPRQWEGEQRSQMFCCLIQWIPLNSVVKGIVSPRVSTQAINIHKHTHVWLTHRDQGCPLVRHTKVSLPTNSCAHCQREFGASSPSCHHLSPVAFPWQINNPD